MYSIVFYFHSCAFTFFSALYTFVIVTYCCTVTSGIHKYVSFLISTVETLNKVSLLYRHCPNTTVNNGGLLAHTHSRGQHEAGGGVGGARARGAPLESVDIPRVLLEVMEPRVLLHAPHLQ